MLDGDSFVNTVELNNNDDDNNSRYLFGEP